MDLSIIAAAEHHREKTSRSEITLSLMEREKDERGFATTAEPRHSHLTPGAFLLHAVMTASLTAASISSVSSALRSWGTQSGISTTTFTSSSPSLRGDPDAIH